MSLFGEAVGLDDSEDLQVILVTALLNLCIMDLESLRKILGNMLTHLFFSEYFSCPLGRMSE